MKLEGILPVWKPAGFTSHDVVAKARRILGIKRIGHTGTLDPQVTGVLPLCINRATRMVEYIQELPKEYEAKLVIGIATDTEDMTGQVIEKAEHVRLDPEIVRQTVLSFQGVIEQIPPMYSAVKVDGKRLYELARAGTVIERKARKVRIYSIEITSLDTDREHPEIGIRVLCSKGTYIRTLCADIGRKLGYPAAMAELTRTSTGGIMAERCLTFEQIAEAKENGKLEDVLIPMDEAVSFLPAYHAEAEQALHALQGKTIKASVPVVPASAEGDNAADGGKDGAVPLVRLYGPEGRFLGLFRIGPDGRTLAPEKVFLPE